MTQKSWKYCVLLTIVVALATTTDAWDSEEMELFDLVEEVNQNFYEVMGISHDATVPEIKKAYRKLSLQLHPDKNDAPDAEVKFRQLVAIYDVLRDENRRARYNQVLVEGLPNWQSPIYYYRRARKMSLLEIAIILTVVISVTQYLMAWGSYIDKRQCMEECLMKKYKIKDRRRKKEDLENLTLMEEALGQIPKPSWWNVLPIQLVKLVVFLVTGGPGIVKQILATIREERERKLREKLEEEAEEMRRKEEEEKRKEKKASRKEARKRVNILPDYTNGGCILEAVDGSESDGPSGKPVKRPAAPAPAPVITGGPWTDEDFSELSRLMAKYPGGTANRWERIAELMGRTVYEVTTMSGRVKARLMQRPIQENEEILPEVKVKVKTKAEKTDLSPGSDEMWSPGQQKALEKALKQNPKGTDQRWDKISRAVPDKTKEECMLRFKFLAEKIRKKKVVESEKQEVDEEEQQNGDTVPQNTSKKTVDEADEMQSVTDNGNAQKTAMSYARNKDV